MAAVVCVIACAALVGVLVHACFMAWMASRDWWNGNANVNR